MRRAMLARPGAWPYVAITSGETCMPSGRPFAISWVAAAALLALLTPALPARATDMAAHRAIYELHLENSRSGDITQASGTMAYEVQDVCDGWATRQRL